MTNFIDRIGLGSDSAPDNYVSPHMSHSESSVLTEQTDTRSGEITSSADEIRAVCLYLYSSGRDVMPQITAQFFAGAYDNVQPTPAIPAPAAETAATVTPEVDDFVQDDKLPLFDGQLPTEAELAAENQKALKSKPGILRSFVRKASDAGLYGDDTESSVDEHQLALESNEVGIAGAPEPSAIDVIATVAARNEAENAAAVVPIDQGRADRQKDARDLVEQALTAEGRAA